MAELDPQIPQSAATIRINPPRGDRQVKAFARLAAVVDRASTTEVPTRDEGEREAGFAVHIRPAEPGDAVERLRHEALALLEHAEADHAEALERSRACWQDVHDREQRVAQMVEEEAAALRAFELLRDARRSAERGLRQARTEGEDASHRCLITSRVLDGARLRADRL